MSKPKASRSPIDPPAGPLLSVRFVVSVLMVVLGIAWLVFYYLHLRTDFNNPDAGGPAFLADLKRWNYLIGFGLIMLGLGAMAHPSTPMGRNRGVVIGMLGCFLVGLVWICVYYIFSDDLSRIPVLNDLQQYNLLVGIAFMGVGFTFATHWE